MPLASIVSIVFGLLLLSAVNTAIVDLIAIQFLMSRDREMPAVFQRLNKWGVPERRHVARHHRSDAARHHREGHGRPGRSLRGRRRRRDRHQSRRDLDGLKTLDQMGTHIDVRHFPRHGRDRNVAAHRQTECALFRRHHSRRRTDPARPRPGTPDEKGGCARTLISHVACACRAVCRCYSPEPRRESVGESILCAIRGTGRTLDFALREARETGRRLYLLFVREQRVHDRAGHETQMAGRS